MESSRVRLLAPALAVAAVALLLPVVGLASRAENAAGAPLLGDDPIRVAFDVLTYLLLMAAGLGLLVIIWVLWPRPGEQPPPLPRRRRELLTAIAMASAVAIAIWLRARTLGRLPNLVQHATGTPAGQLPTAVSRTARAAPGPDWIALAIVAGLIMAAGVLAWRLLRQSGQVRDRSALGSLQALLDDAIKDVLAEADPRRAVIAAWARAERLLAGERLPRRAAEAPFEFAARVEAELGIERVSLQRLAGLYEWARFSLNEVTPTMRQQALGELLQVRDGLRVAV